MSIRADLPPDPFVAALPENAAFWSAAAQGVLLLRYCKMCQKPHWYPRLVCPLCGEGETEWRAASGAGHLYTFSIVRRVAEPYVLAFVTLDEGPTVMTNIVQTPYSLLRADLRVCVVFRPTPEGRCMPFFRAALPSEAGA